MSSSGENYDGDEGPVRVVQLPVPVGVPVTAEDLRPRPPPPPQYTPNAPATYPPRRKGKKGSRRAMLMMAPPPTHPPPTMVASHASLPSPLDSQRGKGEGGPSWCNRNSVSSAGMRYFSAYTAGLSCFSALSAGLALCSLLSINGAFSVLSFNSACSLVSMNSFASVASINSAFSLYSDSGFMTFGCKGESFKVCVDGWDVAKDAEAEEAAVGIIDAGSAAGSESSLLGSGSSVSPNQTASTVTTAKAPASSGEESDAQSGSGAVSPSTGGASETTPTPTSSSPATAAAPASNGRMKPGDPEWPAGRPREAEPAPAAAETSQGSAANQDQINNLPETEKLILSGGDWDPSQG